MFEYININIDKSFDKKNEDMKKKIIKLKNTNFLLLTCIDGTKR